MPGSRIRALTEKGNMMYEEKAAEFYSRLKKCRDAIVECSQVTIDLVTSIRTVNKLEEDVSRHFEIFNSIASTFEDFLVATRTSESENELDKLKHLRDDTSAIVQETFKHIDFVKQGILESLSKRSAKSLSNKSDTSSLAEKQAKAEALKIGAAFAQKEAELKKKKAALEADLELLAEQKQAAVADAEVSALESQQGSLKGSVINVPVQNALDRAAEFVNVHANTIEQKVDCDNYMHPIENTNDIGNFLLKKELLLTRLVSFNDSPDTFLAWRAGFQRVTRELKASPVEELDLLVKFLGVESKRQALSIRTAHYSNPEKGIQELWSRLNERYGKPETIHKTLLTRLENVPKLSGKDFVKLYELADILAEVLALKEDVRYEAVLSYFDSTVGIAPIVAKLPTSLQEKWATRAFNYKKTKGVSFPPLLFFHKFIHEQASIRNDPTLQPATETSQKGEKVKPVIAKVTKFEERCPIHKTAHPLTACQLFKTKSVDDKKKFVRENKLCFRCFSSQHMARVCKSVCQLCGSKFHATMLHVKSDTSISERSHGGEAASNQPINAKCTEICGTGYAKSCAKLTLAKIYSDDNPENIVQCYIIIDEQSNKTLAKPELFDRLGICSDVIDFTINTCTGSSVTSGRKATNCTIQSLDNNVSYSLPTMLECSDIPSNKDEICLPEYARKFPHLSHVADRLPDLDTNADVLVLIGRDLIEAHQVIEQVTGPLGTPFAQRLGLGWVVVGEMCLGQFHARNEVNVNKIHLLSNGRGSLFHPCDSEFSISVSEPCVCDHGPKGISYDPVFCRRSDDNKMSLSVEDREFLKVMDGNLGKSESGCWVAPLPFKPDRPRLPNNYELVLKRAQYLHASLSKNPVKKQLFVEFMAKIIDKGHAEVAPPLRPEEECWYLPIFGVTHPQKPNQVRGVFDSSAQFKGVSLNSVLLQGPDLTNSLLGVLMRFRKEQVPVIADIEQMFYSFLVEERHRNFLRFLWYRSNDPDLDLIEYRMCVHVFGNSPSPAVATYGLRKSVENADVDVQDFVTKDFYVDDGLTSQPSVEMAVSLLQRTQAVLAVHGLHLHKIASSNIEVLKCFPVEDLAKDVKTVDFENDCLPVQRSLGLSWDLNQDCFIFSSQVQDKPVTKRGILSVVNSVFDPIGFLAPVIINGRLILRDVVSSGFDWDEPLTPGIETRWHSWLTSLNELDCVKVPRTLFAMSLSRMHDLELHVFSDASEKAISAVAYIVGFSDCNIKHASFVMGKAKVAPSKGHTIPRLELCAAVLASELYLLVVESLCVEFAKTLFYTDSKVVLGYINNQSRRFYTYVSNRVNMIRQSSSPKQWSYVRSAMNPADIGSRGANPQQLHDSLWLKGPEFLQHTSPVTPEYFPLLNPENDTEVRPRVNVLAISVQQASVLGTKRFERFSSWDRLVGAVGVLRHVAISYHECLKCRGWHICSLAQSKEETERFILRQVQLEAYPREFECLSNNQPLDKNSSILSLDPFLDGGLLRVGGRLGRSNLPEIEKHPIILPGRHHVGKLIAFHCHQAVHHQGRHFTEGAIRSSGYWLIGFKRVVSSMIFNCVKCKKLRGQFECQKMSELPTDRVIQTAPFSHVGVDVFGPWEVVARRTRGGQACSKRWAVLFTCLVIRAVHIEVIDEMSASAFINALRRFIAVRGKVKVFRSDRGTNFVGSTDAVRIDAINVESEKTKKFLYNSGCVWLFNPPHSSHFGGSWERMIGVARRILDPMLSSTPNLTHDVLVTVMAEVMAIVNSRPVTPVSCDIEDPSVLSPAVLLTHKLECDEQLVGEMNLKDLYKDQWKRVQYLADQFWLRWSRDYLSNLQKRVKWHAEKTPVSVGDVVLLKDKELVRNRWPLAYVTQVFPSGDNRIRKAEVAVFRDGKRSQYIRPVVDMIKLLANN